MKKLVKSDEVRVLFFLLVYSVYSLPSLQTSLDPPD